MSQVSLGMDALVGLAGADEVWCKEIDEFYARLANLRAAARRGF
jgi:hypothetical protein